MEEMGIMNTLYACALFLMLGSCGFSPAEKTPGQIEQAGEFVSKKDTIINGWQIQYSLYEDLNDLIIKKSTLSTGEVVEYAYPNHFVLLNIRKDEKIIFDKKITKYDYDLIIPETVIKEYLLWNIWLDEVQDSQIGFYVNICIPDTDMCYPILLTVSEQGNISSSLILENDDEL